MKHHFHNYWLVLLSLMVILTTSCQQKGELKKESAIDAKVDSILSGMTLEEKVGQMTQITLSVLTEGESVKKTTYPAVLDPKKLQLAFGKYRVGSVLNTGTNLPRSTEKWNELINEMQEAAIRETGIPIIYGIDAIHGVNYTTGATLVPQQIGQGATFNPDLVHQLNEICAYEMRASNIPWNFSPVLDMGRDPRDARIWETYGEDVYLNGVLGVAAVDGMQGKDVEVIDEYHGAACLKHYIGYISTSGKDRNPLHIHARELLEKHAPAFDAPIKAGARSIMVNSGIINGVPVHASHDILTKLLRDELGFEGMVVTDWIDIENLHSRDKFAATQKEAVKLAINAGIDMSMVPYNFEFCDHLIDLVNEGEVPMSRINEAVRRILKLKIELGLFEKPTTNFKNYPDFGSKKFEEASYETALESITLLKNQDDILPLKKNIKVLVSGPNANTMRTLNGGWSYSWQGEVTDQYTEQYNTILEAIQTKIGKQNVKFAQGLSYKMDGEYYEEEGLDINAAVKAASDVDVIILCLGENSYTEKPGDLHDLYISNNQKDLALAIAKTGKPVILVLNEGRPRLISKFEDKMLAVVQTYLPGNFGADALVDILFGTENPSGKLPYTYPMFPNSLITYDFKPAEKQEKLAGMYDYESDVAIQYEFGHGLSYTSFRYSNFSVSSNELTPDGSVKVSVTVENTGGRVGKEVVMLFTSDSYASITPDNKRLRRFEKIELEPAKSKIVEFDIRAEDLAFYNQNNQFVAEEGEFIFRIADVEVTVRLTKTVVFGEKSKVRL